MSQEYYSEDHEYIRLEDDIATVGITNHAQEQLGDVVYAEVPDIGRKVSTGEAVAVVESVKAASEIYAPASGEITESNGDLDTNPALVNEDAEGNGWFFKIRLADKGELAKLLSREQYDKFLAENS